MLRNVLLKLFYASLTLFGVVSLVFFLFNVLPGDPAQMMLGQNESPEQLAKAREEAKRVYEEMVAKHEERERIAEQHA